MPENLNRFFSDLADAFSTSNFDECARYLKYPGAFYAGENVMLFRDRENMSQFFRQIHQKVSDRGVHKIESRVVAQSFRSGQRFPVWVEWIHFNKTGEELGKSFHRFFVERNSTGHYRILMFEAIEYAHPDLADELPWEKLLESIE